MDGSQVSFYSNRSGAYMNLGKFEKALEDGTKCVELDSNFVKGHNRKGLALIKLGRF